ncbi:unnamed protein product [Phytophthora fragariaefolia]|uniref:Unnamed protein product n=1 Tax=Phytophthora fragariaefolia TaxID=1490495 RepID=A0A9W6YND4_9STRA|nr:unnamed protein product [Phytophthora fragariaefolia]
MQLFSLWCEFCYDVAFAVTCRYRTLAPSASITTDTPTSSTAYTPTGCSGQELDEASAAGPVPPSNTNSQATADAPTTVDSSDASTTTDASTSKTDSSAFASASTPSVATVGACYTLSEVRHKHVQLAVPHDTASSSLGSSTQVQRGQWRQRSGATKVRHCTNSRAACRQETEQLCVTDSNSLFNSPSSL